MINLNGMESDKLEHMDSYFDERVEIYDEIHQQTGISWGIQIRDMVADYLPENSIRILDLGCGTGLELEGVLKKVPNAKIECLDLSEKMLEKLKEKYPQENVKVRKINFFDFDYIKDYYDAVISVMALHHFTEDEKNVLYKKIYDTLSGKGVFINSDYLIDDPELEAKRFAYMEELKKQHPNELFHYDIPFTEEREHKVLENSGFKQIEKVYENKKTKILVCRK